MCIRDSVTPRSCDIFSCARSSEGMTMASKEHLKILKQGVKAWNEWRRVDMNARPDLSGHDFKGVDLTYINWMVTDLSGANLSGCNLKQAYMTHANLQSADLRKANINPVSYTHLTLPP